MNHRQRRLWREIRWHLFTACVLLLVTAGLFTIAGIAAMYIKFRL